MKAKNLASLVSPLWAIANAVARPVLSRRATRFPCPVISIGNIVAGGVGKTEITALIAKYCLKKGLKVVVAQRGYRSSGEFDWESRGGVAVDYETAASLRFPDEALVLLRKAPGVSVAVGANRAEVLLRHWEELNPNVIILDDGLQHFKIARDLDVIVHDFSTKFPILRDLPRVLRSADTRIAMSDVPKSWQKSGKSWIRARYEFAGFRTRLGASLATEQLGSDGKALAFCGIANPERFLKTLSAKKPQGADINVVEHRFFPDHAHYTEGRVRVLAKWQQKNRLPLVTTLKDFVKLGPWLDFLEQSGSRNQSVCWVDIELKILENADQLWRRIDEVLASHTD